MKKSSSVYNVSKKNPTSVQKIPRPMNCFMTYRVEKQQHIVEQCPGANHRDISKIVAKWWRELPAAEKEPYRIKAAKAKAEHLEKYPEYKFCPKKKASKPRPYKKRPENQFTARDFENKHQLFSLYHDGKLPDPSTPRPTEYDECEFLLDNKPVKQPSRSTKSKKKASLDQEQYPSPASSYPGRNDDHQLELFDNQQASNLQYHSPHSAGLLFPPVNALYYGGSSVPSQSVYSASASPYSTGQHYTHEDPSMAETTISYQLYPDHYGYADVQPAVYGYPVQYHYTNPRPCYGYNAEAIFADPSSCHPLDTHDSHQSGFTNGYLIAPTLLTTPFYY
ncbi:hypothetical protein INT48_002498 [Thamnidium elegans]|uniref:HMG box domain-containing protein n=1 Tax=Thamnidium elegans TaxID=101142 RepID=A0A8H7W095_9FUNG|nr:hypothetical protein INT48_002498 [Thamnidium elegans]